MARFLGALCFCVPCSAYASDYSGQQLLTDLKHGDWLESGTSTNPARDGYLGASADGYINGAVDVMIDAGWACFPEGAKVGQTLAIVRNYLNAHPEQWQRKASFLVGRAITQAFPCQK